MSLRLAAASSEYLRATPFAAVNGGRTVGMWINITSLPAAAAYWTLASFWGSGFTGLGVFINDAGKIVLHSYNSGTVIATSAGSLSTGTWYYIWITVEAVAGSKTVDVYIDGSTTPFVTATATFDAVGLTLNLGRGEGGGAPDSQYFDGRLQYVKGWEAEVAASEAAAEMPVCEFVHTADAVGEWHLTTFADLADRFGAVTNFTSFNTPSTEADVSGVTCVEPLPPFVVDYSKFPKPIIALQALGGRIT